VLGVLDRLGEAVALVQRDRLVEMVRGEQALSAALGYAGQKGWLAPNRETSASRGPTGSYVSCTSAGRSSTAPRARAAEQGRGQASRGIFGHGYVLSGAGLCPCFPGRPEYVCTA